MTRDDSRLTRRDALAGLAGVGVTGALAGCSVATLPGVGSESGSDLRYSTVLPPVSLDPVVRDDPWSASAANGVFQGLYTYDRDLNLVPVLADGEPTTNEAGTTYTVSLVDDATFQDGTRVSAADVKYSFEAPVVERTRPLWQVEMVSEIRTPDERTVEFHLDEPYPAFEHSLTRAVVPESVRRGNAAAFGTDPDATVGSGPYRVRLFKPGKYASLDRWTGYWGDERPAIDRVRVVTTPAGLARTMALKTGQSDVVERVQPKLWEATRRIPSADVVTAPSYNYFFVGFNCGAEPTDDPTVREAVDYLLSMDDFVDGVVGPAGRRQHGPLPGRLAEAWGMPTEEWKGVSRRKNVETARRLFAEAGVERWSPKVAVPRGDKLRAKLAQALVRGLASAGFRRARVVKYPWREFRDRVTSGNASDYSMYVGSWAGYPDPDTFLYPLFHQRMEDLTNGVFYRNPDVMEAIEAARRTRDRAERERRYEAAIDAILRDRVHLPAFTLDNSFGLKRRVSGFRPHSLSRLNPRLSAGDGTLRVSE